MIFARHTDSSVFEKITCGPAGSAFGRLQISLRNCSGWIPFRVAAGLKQVRVKGAALVWSSFYDDFIVISHRSDAANADITVRHLFNFLGWGIS